MDWPNFFCGIFYSFLPKAWWGKWQPSSTVDLARSGLMSGLFEFGISLFLLIHEYLRFLVIRTHQLQAASTANQGTQLYFLVLLTFEYAIHPLSLIVIYLVAEGALRSWAAFFTDEVVPSLPLRLSAHISVWWKRRRNDVSPGAEIPDRCERSQGGADELHICSQRPKDGWHTSITVAVEGEFYEIARVATDQSIRPVKYVLRKLPAGGVMRGMYRYDPPDTN